MQEYFIQVENDKVYERELRAFKTIDNTNKKILITNDDIDYSTSAVEHIKLKDFLLMDSLEDL